MSGLSILKLMKFRLSRHRPLAVTLLLLFMSLALVSCSPNDSTVFGGLANGADLPAVYAIASGNAVLMIQCLDALTKDYYSGTLSATEMSRTALEIVDLLAVLSSIMKELTVYFREGVSPDTLLLEDFVGGADRQYLLRIGEGTYIDNVLPGDPSPLQLLWMALGTYVYLESQHGPAPLEQGDLNQDEYDSVMNLIDLAIYQANETGNSEALSVLAELKNQFEKLDPP